MSGRSTRSSANSQPPPATPPDPTRKQNLQAEAKKLQPENPEADTPAKMKTRIEKLILARETDEAHLYQAAVELKKELVAMRANSEAMQLTNTQDETLLAEINDMISDIEKRLSTEEWRAEVEKFVKSTESKFNNHDVIIKKILEASNYGDLMAALA